MSAQALDSTADALEQALAVITAAPAGASALTLYALVTTLEYQGAGALFKLTKLKDLDPAHRAIAYALMECLAAGQVGGADWRRVKAQMDALIRRG
jgi:hypothetical protein